MSAPRDSNPPAAPVPRAIAAVSAKPSWTYAVLIASILAGASLFVIPPPGSVNPHGWHALGLIIPIIAVWATEAIPVGVASMVFLALVVGFKLVAADVAFKGFTTDLPWLMLGAFSIGLAMQKTGLSKRVAFFLLSRLKGFWGVTFAVYATNTCFMAVPSSEARAGVLSPFLTSIMTSIGRPKRSNLSRLMTYYFCAATTLFVENMFLTSGAANLVLMALYQQLTGVSLGWGEWLVLMFFPNLLLTATSIVAARLLSPPEPELVKKIGNVSASREEYRALGPMSADEWKVLAIYLLAIVLWVTASLTGFRPGFSALLIAGLLFAPKIGVLPGTSLHDLNWDVVLLLGAVAGVGGILQETGMLDAVSGWLVAPVLNPLAEHGLVGIALGSIIVGFVAHWLLPGPSNLALAIPLLLTWGIKTMHLPPAQVLAFLGLLSALGDKLILLIYQMPTYYTYLSMDVTDTGRFNALLLKLYPILAVAIFAGAFIAYGMIELTGFGVG